MHVVILWYQYQHITGGEDGKKRDYFAGSKGCDSLEGGIKVTKS